MASSDSNLTEVNSPVADTEPARSMRLIVCGICQDGFNFWRELKYHMWKQHNVVPMKLRCPECSSAFAWSGELRRHYRKEHSLLEFPCSECDMTYDFRQQMERHKLLKHESVRYPCLRCGKDYADYYYACNHCRNKVRKRS
jgi:KRAB domain-containing zinc finger protein